MQKTSKFLQGFRKDLALFSLVFVFICIISCSLVTVLPSVDRAVCYHQLSQKLGITNNYQDLRKHIGESLKTGMNRADAKSALQSFGPVSVLPGEQIIDHQITD